jgi:hypothetical protein
MPKTNSYTPEAIVEYIKGTHLPIDVPGQLQKEPKLHVQVINELRTQSGDASSWFAPYDKFIANAGLAHDLRKSEFLYTLATKCENPDVFPGVVKAMGEVNQNAKEKMLKDLRSRYFWYNKLPKSTLGGLNATAGFMFTAILGIVLNGVISPIVNKTVSAGAAVFLITIGLGLTAALGLCMYKTISNAYSNFSNVKIANVESLLTEIARKPVPAAAESAAEAGNPFNEPQSTASVSRA